MKYGLRQHSVTIDSIPLDRIGNDCKSTSTKYLGMHIDENLSSKNHVTEVTKTVSRALFSIKQVKHMLPLNSLRTLYFALIHSHFTYGIVAMLLCNKKGQSE